MLHAYIAEMMKMTHDHSYNIETFKGYINLVSGVLTMQVEGPLVLYHFVKVLNVF